MGLYYQLVMSVGQVMEWMFKKMLCTWSALETGGIFKDTAPLASGVIKHQLLLVCMGHADTESTQRGAWMQDTSYVCLCMSLCVCVYTHVYVNIHCIF